jgi:RimJ/RimL family protein N-acetyltransferase
MRTLRTARLDLVPFDLARDQAGLHEMYADAEWARTGFTEVSRDLAGTTARLENEFGGTGGLVWVLKVRPGTQPVGVIGVVADQGTPVRGIGWYLHRDHWGQGLMSEAAREVVAVLLDQPGIDGVEAWIDSRNLRSIGVARRAGLDLVGRLPRVNETETAISLLMARSAQPADPTVIGLRPRLVVGDVAATTSLLVSVLGLHLRFQYGEPQPEFARIGLSMWNEGNGIDLQAGSGDISPASISLDLGRVVDPVHDAAVAAGARSAAAPADLPWDRRECTLELPDGHQLLLSGPLRPPL